MKTDKQVKADFREIASREPQKHYPVRALKEFGFSRKQCENCKKFFWSMQAYTVFCGEPACSGGYRFVGDSPAKKQFDYLGAWDAFKKHFKKLGYFEYKTYPVVARWRPDVYWVGASVYPFQPYVVSGEIKPKSNAVIIPQLCLRFNDIDNVGVTGSHYVCFDMLGQLHFEKKKDYAPEVYWKEYFEWINKGMGVPEEEIFVHEDAWAGGGNFGPCMEFFSRGMEIGNQVYMQYGQTEGGFKELDIKVLDMGQGHERIPWFTTGKSTSYETTFPSVVKYLYRQTSVKADEKFLQRFLPYSALLNFDEVNDIELVWKEIAKKLSVDVKELKEKIMLLSELYSIGEHSRAALVALTDGALPSNAGGGYNLRVIMRRAMEFIEKNGWDMDFQKLVELHVADLKSLYPHLGQNLKDVEKIIESEQKKFRQNKQRTALVVLQAIKKPLDTDALIEFYDSHGINPEIFALEAKKVGKNTVVPQNFYALISERHAQKEQVTATKKTQKIDLTGVPKTKILYYNDWRLTEFSAKIVKIIGELVALDQTAFYPTSGGQIFDTGFLEKFKVTEAFKQGDVVLHRVPSHTLMEGQHVFGKIDFERRKQLMQHHSGVHVVNLCTRKLLGPHAYQAGAAKTLEKGRIDITHFEQLSEKELNELQKCAYEIIAKNVPVKKEFLPREVAEEKYGMRIYQGGFIAGRNLRIVSIEEDSEACGGTHANFSGEIGKIKILGSTKVQDGIIRISLVCGNALTQADGMDNVALSQTLQLLGVKKELVLSRIEELFLKWKKAAKAGKKGEKLSEKEFNLSSDRKTNLNDKETLKEAAKLLGTQKENVPKTVKRFLEELQKFKEQNFK
ncbi:MAG: alanine--tRNA ligase [Candidatus Diapherotrites archaeon]|nr:alanine--tRNA ligase [Candidatus Diapherotrites archaeon]